MDVVPTSKSSSPPLSDKPSNAAFLGLPLAPNTQRRPQDEALRLSRCSDVAEAASYFVDKGVGLVVITRGAKGAFALSREETAASVGSAGREEEEGLDAKAEDAGQGHREIRTWEQRCARVEVSSAAGVAPGGWF